MQQADNRTVTAAQTHNDSDRNGELRLARLRLRLALLTMAVLPVALAMILFKAVVDARYGAAQIGIVVAMVALTLLMVVLMVRMTRQILRPYGSVALAPIDTGHGDSGQADSLRDGLTGLGNHRAFQEELDRELEWYSALQRSGRAAAHRSRRPEAGQRLRAATPQATRCCARWAA